MCGILGSAFFKDLDFLKFKSVLDNLNHRGPDSKGTFKDENCFLGHTRLAIIDLTAGGHQPMSDYSGRYTITFNGEIYNYKDLRNSMIEYPFLTHSDTEVILAMFSVYGYDTPKYLKGQFAFAIWDKVNEELFVARDRIGEKPFYYFQDDGNLCFASEIRTLIKLSKTVFKIRQASLAEYLQFQSVAAPNTLLEGVYQLPAACYGVVKKSSFEYHKYWETDSKKNGDYQSKEIIHRTIKDLLYEAVGLQMCSDVPLGAFLSGGIDSSAIVGLMATQRDQPIETFTVGFDETRYNESHFAAIIAKKFNTRHCNLVLKSNDFKRRIPEILSKIDNPSADGPNTFIVSEAVKKAGITVALSGLGGDELFAGYDSFKRFYQFEKFKNLWNLTMPLRYLVSKSMRGKKMELLQISILNIHSFYPLMRSLYSVKETNRLLNTESKIFEIPSFLIDESLPILSQFSIAELTGYTQNVLLKDTDQMSMASSLEVRVPFFDHDLIEYVLGVPDQYKYPKFPKSLLVESLGDILPYEIVHRKKMGFSFPWAEWMRADLKTFCEESITNLKKRNIFDAFTINDYWNRFLNNDPQISWSKIWLLITLEHWLVNLER